MTPMRVQLSGLRTLVVEDRYVIAREICRQLRTLGCEPIGPAPDQGQALMLLDHDTPDCALLDVNLDDDTVYPFAAELRRRAVPFLFATGYDRAVIPAPFHDVFLLEKPFGLGELRTALMAMMGQTASAAGA